MLRIIVKCLFLVYSVLNRVKHCRLCKQGRALAHLSTRHLSYIQNTLTWLQSLSVAQAHKAGVVHLGLHGNHR